MYHSWGIKLCCCCVWQHKLTLSCSWKFQMIQSVLDFGKHVNMGTAVNIINKNRACHYRQPLSKVHTNIFNRYINRLHIVVTIVYFYICSRTISMFNLISSINCFFWSHQKHLSRKYVFVRVFWYVTRLEFSSWHTNSWIVLKACIVIFIILVNYLYLGHI